MRNDVVSTTRNWVERVVIGLNLCPFAKREWVKGSIRIIESDALDNEALLQNLVVELALLARKPEIETTIIVHPQVLVDFDDYNQFLSFTDVLLEEMQLDGVYQIASFHPDYQFAGTAHGDAENFTNRSPFPMLHVLREASLDSVIESHKDTEQIPLANIALLKKLGAEHMQGLLSSCND
ncbi:DUF1415 domain-containing protein [Arenicella sp. 4NH20-0111]|uniref:DUF1415 domain-containing protein n=1 Tax=Arenicella sp. 4NH20-0111 TaxID=3127648 RepID=UPI003106F5D1